MIKDTADVGNEKKKPSTRRDSNPWPLNPEAYVLPQCRWLATAGHHKKVNCFSDLGRTLDLPVEAAQRNGAFVADSQPGDLFKQFFAFAAIF